MRSLRLIFQFRSAIFSIQPSGIRPSKKEKVHYYDNVLHVMAMSDLRELAYYYPNTLEDKRSYIPSRLL